jgi:hypothetical protein
MLSFDLIQANIIDSRAELTWETLPWLSMRALWAGSFLEVPELVPRHTFGLNIDLHTEDRRWSGSLESELEPTSQIRLRSLAAAVSFAPGTGVEFILRGSDLLAPLMQQPRTVWEYYETPGLYVAFSTRISL